jgi:hypothetical protein
LQSNNLEIKQLKRSPWKEVSIGIA